MFSNRPAATWPLPPEIPPQHPPGRGTPPRPTLPSWDEPLPFLDTEVADRLLQRRVLILGGRLDDAAANRVAAQLLLLGRENDEPIELHLTCSESELDAAVALADTMDMLQAPVHAVVRGSLRGPGLAVLCAARRRRSHRHAAIVLSLPQISAAGDAARLATLAAEHERQVARLRDRIASTTGRPAQEVERDLTSGLVLSAQDALEYGLLDALW